MRRFMLRFVSLFLTLIMFLSVPVTARASEVNDRVEFAVVVALDQGRYGCPDRITVELYDGNVYVVEQDIEDTFVGDIFLVNRVVNSVLDPRDDQVELLKYVGYEYWDHERETFVWNLWLCDHYVSADSTW